MLQYRHIEEKDNKPLVELIREVFVEHGADDRSGTILSDPTTDDLFALFRQSSSVLWLALDRDQVVGCCGIYPTDGLPQGCVELVKFYVLQNWRGRGIGKELMLRSIQSAKDLGFRELYLESLPEFELAVGMYQKYGFEHLEEPMGNSGHFGCTIWMLKEI